MDELKPQEAEALDILEAMLDVCDLENPGPMFAGQHVRGVIGHDLANAAAKLRQYIADHRAAPENEADLSEIGRVIRLYESATECPCDTYAQLILAALREYKAQYTENKALKLDELRQMDGDWVWLTCAEHPEYDGYYSVRPFPDGSGGIELYGVDNNYYERAITAGSVKVYTRKP